jgi:hypothetical protein
MEHQNQPNGHNVINQPNVQANMQDQALSKAHHASITVMIQGEEVVAKLEKSEQGSRLSDKKFPSAN